MTRLLLALTLALPLAAPALAETEVAPDRIESVGADDHTDAWRAYLTDRRQVQRDRLVAYAHAGVFPINNEQPGMLNIFMDEEGRRCAMAHLIWEDGESDLVTRTAQRDNDLRLGTVKRGPLMDWMKTSGLTQDEVAFIQEPDFYIEDELDPILQADLVEAERDRLKAHFMGAAMQLDAYGAQSIDAMIKALGKRVNEPPPAAE